MAPHRFGGFRAAVVNAFRSPTRAVTLRPTSATGALYEPPGPSHKFFWSRRALRVAAWTVASLTLAALPAMASQATTARVLVACWLTLMLILAHVVANRACSSNPVVTIDALGITDRRLLSARVYWQDIASLERADLDQTKVIEFFLKQPSKIAAGGSLGLRLGAWLQRRIDVPAMTINLILLDASAADVARAVAEFRPGLVPFGLLKS